MTYYEAKRQARAMFGVHGDAMEVLSSLIPYRIGVWLEENRTRRFVIVGSGLSFDEAVKDAKDRQVT